MDLRREYRDMTCDSYGMTSIIMFDTFARYQCQYSTSANVCVLCLSPSLEIPRGVFELGTFMFAQYERFLHLRYKNEYQNA